MIFISNNQFNRRAAFSGGGGWGCLIIGGILSIGLYFLLKAAYEALWYASPFLLALALIINWRAVADSAKGLVALLGLNPIGALLKVAFIALLFPFYSLYLVFKALGHKQLQKMKEGAGDGFGGFGTTNTPFFDPRDPFPNAQRDEYVDYEEIESTPLGQEKNQAKEAPMTPPGLPEKESDTPKNKGGNPYDKMFE